MINVAIEILKNALPNLPFVEVYAGLVSPAVKKDEVCDENGNVIGYTEQRFPIACGMSAIDCFQNGKYRILTPDSSKKSVFYFEQLTDAIHKQGDGKSNLLFFQANVRLVGWLNLQRLGLLDHCSLAGYFAVQTASELVGTYSMDTPFVKSSFSVSLVKQVLRSASIFSKYNYEQSGIQYLLFPYDYFALDFRVTVKVNKACLEEIMLGEAVQCLPV